MSAPAANRQVADKLRQAADLLGQQGANPFRVGAYRRAADAIAHLGRDVREIVDQEGSDGLVALPHVREVRMEHGRCTVVLDGAELQVSRRHTRELRDRLLRAPRPSAS